MSKIKNDGLDQYGAEPFEQQQFGTAGVEGVNTRNLSHTHLKPWLEVVYRDINNNDYASVCLLMFCVRIWRGIKSIHTSTARSKTHCAYNDR